MLALGTAWLGVGSLLVSWGRAHAQDPLGEGPLVVAGCAPRRDGRPSACILRRVGAALDSLDSSDRALFFTGGATRSGPPEGQVAATVARDAGISEARIRIEQTSHSTWTNATEVARLWSPPAVVVVTDDFHAWRTVHVFQCHASDVTVRTARTSGVDLWWGAAREVWALTWYALRGRLCIHSPTAG